jgi:hypothetical protein
MDLDDLILLVTALRSRRRRRRRPLFEPREFAATRRPILEWLHSPTLLYNATGLKLETLQRLCN